MRIVLFGPPGSGKGTYSAILKMKLGGIEHISTGDLVRDEIGKKTPLGKQIEKYSSSGRLIPDETITEILKPHLLKNGEKGFILEGYPRSIGQAKQLEEILNIDVVVNLNISDNMLVDRLSARSQCKKCGAIYNDLTLKSKVAGKCDKCGGELFKREDDQPNVIMERLKVYHETSEPVVEFYRSKGLLKDVTSNDPKEKPENVAERILSLLKS